MEKSLDQTKTNTTDALQKQQHRLLAPDACLVEEFVQHLLKYSAEELQNVTVLLPTQRLATAIIAALAITRRAFFPPRLLTIESYIENLLEHRGAAASDDLVELLLGLYISKGNYSHIKDGDEHEVRQLFEEMEEFDLGEDDLRSLPNQVLADHYHSENHMTLVGERTLELASLYSSMQKSLSHLKLSTRNRLHKALVRGHEHKVIKLEHPVYIVGFTTCKEYMKPLLSRLAKQKNAFFWFSKVHLPLSDLNPVADLTKSVLDVVPPVVQKQRVRQHQYNIHECRNIVHEMKSVAQMVQTYIRSGVAPSHIAILLTQEKRYTKPLQTILQSMGVVANFSTPSVLRETDFGSFLIAIQQWLENPVIALAEKLKQHPYFNEQAVDKILELNQAELQSLSDLSQKFLELLQTLVPHDQSELHEVLKHFQSVFTQCVMSFDPLVSFAKFFAMLAPKMLSTEIRSTGYPFEGVQVLRLIEARYVPFKVVFILGCEEGLFPRKKPDDFLLDDWLKKQLGLRGWSYVESLEDTTFQLLKARVQHLHLCYSKNHLDQPVVRSRYIEQLVYMDHVPVMQTEAFELEERPPSAIQSGVVDPVLKRTLLKSMSATKLQDLLTCPYRFMMRGLGVQEPISEQAQTVIDEGKILHKIWQEFFEGAPKFAKVLPAQKVTPYLQNRFASVLERYESKLSKAVLTQLTTFAIPRFIEFYQRFYADREPGVRSLVFHKSLREYPVSNTIDFSLADGTKFSVTVNGVVDALDETSKGQMLVDYKRKSVRVGEQKKQLALYMKLLGSDSTVTGFWSLLEGKWYGVACSKELQPWAVSMGLVTSSVKDTGFLQSELMSDWQKVLDELLVDNKPFSPKVGKHCEWCALQNVCRAKDPHCSEIL